jgi:DNA-binding MarR family transcriptional regulator
MPENRVDFEHDDALLDEMDSTVLLLGRLMAARHSEQCEGHAVNGPRLMVLKVLAEAGPIKSGDLASVLGIKAPATTSLVDGLEREGLVAREHDADDRRITLVSLTEEGRSVLATAERIRRQHMRTFLAVLPEDDVRTLIRIQRTLIDAIVEREA